MNNIIHWAVEAVLVILLISFVRDGLTGLWVRRVYQFVYPLALKARGWTMLMDLDNLKDINNNGGHKAGDFALRAVARIVRRHGGLLSFRFGGDEFALLLPFADEAGAKAVADKICAACKSVGFPVSIGLGRFEQEADARLYRAKEAGKSNVNGKPG